MQLPKGLFFDPKRNRYRVRLYRGAEIVHLSYHKTLDEALDLYKKIVDDRPEIKTGPGSLTTSAMFAFLTT